MTSLQKQLRIIGGSLRSRLISFDPHEGIRPTANRVRETLFNWLSSIMPEAKCLDLFAGSGALSFEALSRGASFVVINDRSPKIARQLQQMVKQFNISFDQVLLTQVKIDQETLFFPKLPVSHFDVVFIDPPFGKGLIYPSLKLLLKQNWIDARSFIYVEAEKDFEIDDALLALNQKFNVLKSGQTAQTVYFLLQLDNPL